MNSGEKYTEIQKYVDDFTHDLKSSFPLVCSVFDKEIRIRFSNHEWSKPAEKRNFVINFCKKKFFRILVNSPFFKINDFKSSKVYLNIQQFNELSNKIEAFAKKRKLGVISEAVQIRRGELLKINNSFLFRSLNLELLDEFVWLMNTNLINAFEDKKHLKRLEKHIELEVQFIQRFLLKKQIKLIISSGDSSIFMKLLLTAARRLNVPFYVICHGYIQDPYLITIAPIFSDRLFVWSDNQKQKLVEDLEVSKCGSKEKVFFSGYPGDFLERNDSLSGERKILLLLEPFYYINQRESVEHIRELVNILSDCGQLTVRFHPLDKKENQFLIEVPEFSNKNIKFSETLLSKEIENADVILGTNTQVLYIASLFVNHVFQIKELAWADFEGVQSVGLSKIENLLRQIFDRGINEKLFEKKAELKIFDVSTLFDQI